MIRFKLLAEHESLPAHNKGTGVWFGAGALNVDIGQNPVLLLRSPDGSVGAALCSNDAANSYKQSIDDLLKTVLEKFERKGFQPSSLESAMLGGAENSKWKWVHLQKIAKKAFANLQEGENGGLYYRTISFETKSGVVTVARKKANPNDWNPASANLSLESGTKGFSEGNAGGVVANATRFFRQESTFKALREEVIPTHLRETPDQPFLFWSAACSAGAEAYSYAMYIHRTLARAGATCPFRVYATDINQTLVEGAKSGEYKVSKSDIANFKAYFQRYGTLEGDTVVFGKEIKQFITFGTFDLKQRPRKTGFRMVVCANVFQYYDDDARMHFLENFISAVTRPGYIFVGPTRDSTLRELGLRKLAKYNVLLAE
ncbi:MAG: hypothetical protein HY280_10205 [Nitrospinae bacterium]|nr:hypothetical protein [Nitrospinota bacterium]